MALKVLICAYYVIITNQPANATFSPQRLRVISDCLFSPFTLSFLALLPELPCLKRTYSKWEKINAHLLIFSRQPGETLHTVLTFQTSDLPSVWR